MRLTKQRMISRRLLNAFLIFRHCAILQVHSSVWPDSLLHSHPSRSPGGLIFVCGSREGLMTLSGRRHNTDDIIATVLAVEPMKFIYRGRIAVFSTAVLREERVVIVAEQRPDCSEEESFQWMSRVLQVSFLMMMVQCTMGGMTKKSPRRVSGH